MSVRKRSSRPGTKQQTIDDFRDSVECALDVPEPRQLREAEVWFHRHAEGIVDIVPFLLSDSIDT